MENDTERRARLWTVATGGLLVLFFGVVFFQQALTWQDAPKSVWQFIEKHLGSIATVLAFVAAAAAYQSSRKQLKLLEVQFEQERTTATLTRLPTLAAERNRLQDFSTRMSDALGLIQKVELEKKGSGVSFSYKEYVHSNSVSIAKAVNELTELKSDFPIFVAGYSNFLSDVSSLKDTLEFLFYFTRNPVEEDLYEIHYKNAEQISVTARKNLILLQIYIDLISRIIENEQRNLFGHERIDQILVVQKSLRGALADS